MTEPAYLLHCQKILAMPGERYVRRAVEFLHCAEMNALLAAPDRSSWPGRRDRAILSLALQTGLRVSEIINLRRHDIELGTGAHVRCEGKGRKQRCTPLRRESTQVLTVWLKERAGLDDGPLFPTMRGTKLSHDAMERMVHEYILLAAKSCPSLANKRVTPHVLRHSTAMDLLHHGLNKLSSLSGSGTNPCTRRRFTSILTCDSKRKHWHESPPRTRNPDDIGQTMLCSRFWSRCNYADQPRWIVT
jgi:site-specific recombinase XerD